MNYYKRDILERLDRGVAMRGTAMRILRVQGYELPRFQVFELYDEHLRNEDWGLFGFVESLFSPVRIAELAGREVWRR